MNNSITFSPDKFGYYTIGDYKTYSKFEALELQKATGHFPEWNFNKEVFNNLQWKIEPNVDIWELYKLRAKQIRQNYDYVVLMYSGGSDSYNMIDAWIAADCKIDEIATFWNYEGSKNKDDFGNAEINQVVLKQIPKFKERAEFDFRLIDLSKYSLEFIKQSNDLVYNFNLHICPHRLVIASFRQKIQEYADIINSGKKLCFVWGADKPQVFYDGEFYTQFFDMLDNNVGPSVQQNYHNGLYDELFYWTPDMPEIVLKQSHIVKRFLKSCNEESFYQNDFSPFGYNPNIKKYLKKTSFSKLLYPTFDPYTFTTGKNPNKLFSMRDKWIWESNLEEKEKIINAIKYFVQSLDPYWFNDGDVFKGVKRHASPKYYL